MSNSGCLISDNDKFGGKAFSLLPHQSCIRIGIATELCASRCFAFGSYADRPHAYQFIEKNHTLTRRSDFVPRMIYQIRRAGVRDFRIHSIGDFDDPPYLDKWIEIAEECPDVAVLLYTHAWQDQSFIPGLSRLASLPNVNLWLSEDSETGRSPALPETQVAWLADTDGSNPPDYARIVFRATVERLTQLYIEDGKLKATRQYTPLRVMGNTPVCLHQNGLSGMPATCVECRLCMWKTK